jgi:2-dehydropantoate 2-reductase
MTPPPASSHPPWLTPILRDTSPAPRTYSWTPAGTSRIHRADEDEDDLARRIYILGVGNLGRLYASSLAKLPNRPPITLVLHRKELLTEWHASNGGIEITRQGITESDKASFDVAYWTEIPPPTGEGEGGSVREIFNGGEKKIGNLIISTKASLAIPEVDRLRRYLGPQSTVAFAQNGMNKLWPPHGQAYVSHRYPMAEAEAGEARAGPPSFVHCITGHGLTSLGSFKSKHAASADVKVGPVLPGGRANASKYLIDQIAGAPYLNSRVVSKADLWILQLEKLVFNTVINPLTAILRVKNGVLFEKQDGPVANVMDHVVRQTSAVYLALINHPSTADILLSDSDKESIGDSPSHAALQAARRRLTERFSFTALRPILWEFGIKVGENNSSMFQDVTEGKSTEIRDLNGWVVDMARFLESSSSSSSSSTTSKGLDVSAHETLIELVEQGKVLRPEQLAEAVLPK